ncbi:MarR family winged helix-turn-helix transcriptional regulator [Phreatobacter oligotrophus]|uniref:MarR family winged helix-turn-helix transcriptional regulator n=1 Tax=Phreatobacter oligotrophus TaxID=1122261 RepID=UPI0023566820|nr:MarR family winged helix-turn-helix transcriptional regulator [Phreatobacter oligotrophus]MBX9989375.1 MarR family winged helix-turn-helix transcriptional regulator [Phreatobacter oligotrophus]
MSRQKDDPKGGHEPYRKTIGAHLQHAARLHRALVARKLTILGLYPGQEQVLKILADGGDMMMGELAGALKVRPPTASKTIGRLAAQGLVERRTAGGADGRLVQVGLTQAGRDKAAAIDDLWFAAEDEMLADMDAKEARRLRKLLRRIEKTLRPHAEDAADEEDEAEEA